MRVVQKVIEVRTRKRVEVLDITQLVREELESISPVHGLLHVFVPHTTAGITLNGTEEGLLKDLEDLLEKLVPELEKYEHNRIDNNAHAHLRTILLGSSLVLPVREGNLLTGTWQRVLLVEGDGPRTRRVVLTYVGL